VAVPSHIVTDAPRRPARDLIEAVLENMRRNLEPLKYSTIAPNRYIVYLHPDEFARIDGILPLLQEQTQRALDEELQKLNKRSLLHRYFGRLIGGMLPVQAASRQWQVEFVPDADDEVRPGDILIHSDLVFSGPDELGAGQSTRRVVTRHVGQRTTTESQIVTTQTTPSKVVARLRYEDDAGKHSYDMVADLITVGRGGSTHRVDVRIAAAVDVSREHLRIRRDARTGQFFVTDVSMLGTTVNGRRLPKGYDEVDGVRQENGIEAPLADGARIGLAEMVYLDFEVVRG
jgi:hypothetical protein